MPSIVSVISAWKPINALIILSEKENLQRHILSEKTKVSIHTWTPGRGLRWFAETPKPAAYMNMNRTGMGVSDHAGATVCVERIILDQLKLDEVAQRQTEIQRSSLKQKIWDSVR